MSLENVQAYFSTLGLADRIKILENSSATVEDAAHALGCLPEKNCENNVFCRDRRKSYFNSDGWRCKSR